MFEWARALVGLAVLGFVGCDDFTARTQQASSTVPWQGLPRVEGQVRGRVVGVHDGDTITVLDADKTQHKIRLLGIDAPELKQPFGQVSKQHLSGGCFGRWVTVLVRQRDRYGREVGQVFVQRAGQVFGDSTDLNLRQIRAGYAWHYKQYAKEQDPEGRRLYSEAEEEARLARRGLWAEPNPMAPWAYRKAKRN